MFSSKELSVLSLDCFRMEMCRSDVCELVSQNDDHWIILKQQLPKTKRLNDQMRHFDFCVQMYHRHEDADGFHLHRTVTSVLDAALEIIAHDDFRLGRKDNSFFFEVVKMFTET